MGTAGLKPMLPQERQFNTMGSPIPKPWLQVLSTAWTPTGLLKPD